MTETNILARIAKRGEIVNGMILSVAGAGAPFETDQVITDEPTLYFALDDPTVKKFLLTEVSYYMLQTNAVVYNFYLFGGAEAVDLTSMEKMLYQSPGAQAKDQVYVRCNNENDLPKMVDLDVAGVVWYLINWTAAPGVTPGFIRVRGIKVA